MPLKLCAGTIVALWHELSPLLLITDRLGQSSGIRDALRQMQPVKTLALVDACRSPATHLFVVCHVDVALRDTARLLSAAIAHHRVNPHVPVLALVPRPSDLLSAVDSDLAFNEVLPETTDGVSIRGAIRRCRQRVEQGPSSAEQVDPVLLTSVRCAELTISNVLNAARRRQPVAKADLVSGSHALLSMVRQSQIQDWIAVVKRHDDGTYQHCLLVAGLVAGFANHLGLMPDHQHILAQAALLHDVGKANIPRDILNKTASLTEGERALIETHCAIGHAYLSGQDNISSLILDVVRHHHETLDGVGYPDRLTRFQISDDVRIVTICDIYAALIERRPYRKAMPSDSALGIMRDMGPKLDRTLLSRFSSFVSRPSIAEAEPARLKAI